MRRLNGKKAVFLCLLMLSVQLNSVSLAETKAHWLDEYRTANPELYNKQGYRKRQYRAPTPESVSGATLVDTHQLQALLTSEQPTHLINVLPLKTFENGFIIDKDYTHIAKSVWLPNVGRGTLSPQVEEWFFRRLDTISQGDKTASLVFYCRADCWMSWNTVKRVARQGYTGLYWYRDGLDAWRESSLPEVVAVPESYF